MIFLENINLSFRVHRSVSRHELDKNLINCNYRHLDSPLCLFREKSCCFTIFRHNSLNKYLWIRIKVFWNLSVDEKKNLVEKLITSEKSDEYWTWSNTALTLRCYMITLSMQLWSPYYTYKVHANFLSPFGV